MGCVPSQSHGAHYSHDVGHGDVTRGLDVATRRGAQPYIRTTGFWDQIFSTDEGDHRNESAIFILNFHDIQRTQMR